jgi:hypothetical protein
VELKSEQHVCKLEGVKGRLIRILVLLWLGWYLSGPLAETVDFWDTPREEASDLIQSAGGLVALLGAAMVVGVAQCRKLRERLRMVSRQGVAKGVCSNELMPDSTVSFLMVAAHSPPITLRI